MWGESKVKNLEVEVYQVGWKWIEVILHNTGSWSSPKTWNDTFIISNLGKYNIKVISLRGLDDWAVW